MWPSVDYPSVRRLRPSSANTPTITVATDHLMWRWSRPRGKKKKRKWNKGSSRWCALLCKESNTSAAQRAWWLRSIPRIIWNQDSRWSSFFWNDPFLKWDVPAFCISFTDCFFYFHRRVLRLYHAIRSSNISYYTIYALVFNQFKLGGIFSTDIAGFSLQSYCIKTRWSYINLNYARDFFRRNGLFIVSFLINISTHSK